MKILITGGAGFIGSAVSRYAIENLKHEIIILDKLTYAGNLNSLLPIKDSQRFSFIQADICDHNQLNKIFRDVMPETVMHLAAESHVDRSINAPNDFIQTNIIGTYNLLEISRSYFSELDDKKKKTLGSIIFQLMKSLAIFMIQTIYLLRNLLTCLVHLIQPLKLVQIIW